MISDGLCRFRWSAVDLDLRILLCANLRSSITVYYHLWRKQIVLTVQESSDCLLFKWAVTAVCPYTPATTRRWPFVFLMLDTVCCAGPTLNNCTSMYRVCWDCKWQRHSVHDYRGLKPRSGIEVSKKQKVSSPLTRNDLILWEASVTVR